MAGYVLLGYRATEGMLMQDTTQYRGPGSDSVLVSAAVRAVRTLMLGRKLLFRLGHFADFNFLLSRSRTFSRRF